MLTRNDYTLTSVCIFSILISTHLTRKNLLNNQGSLYLLIISFTLIALRHDSGKEELDSGHSQRVVGFKNLNNIRTVKRQPYARSLPHHHLQQILPNFSATLRKTLNSPLAIPGDKINI